MQLMCFSIYGWLNAATINIQNNRECIYMTIELNAYKARNKQGKERATASRGSPLFS